MGGQFEVLAELDRARPRGDKSTGKMDRQSPGR